MNGESESIKVMVVENRQLIIDAMIIMFQDVKGIELIGFAGTYEEIRDIVTTQMIDVVILDMQCPAIDGIKAIEKIKKYSPQTKVIMLGNTPDEWILFRGIHAGAETFLLTDVSNEQLISAVKEIHRGGHVLSGKAAKIIVNCVKGIQLDSKEYLEMRLREKGYHFTNRELDIAYLLMHNYTNSQISQKLRLEEGTVKNYISEIYSKLNIHKRSRAVAFLRKLTKEAI